MSVMDVFMDAALACTVLDYGDHALMLQCDSTADAMAWTDALRAAALPGVVDIVAASRTVLVKLDAPRYQGVTRQRLRRLRVTPEAVAAADHRCDLVIDVVYDGPDLAEVARCTGLTTAAVINAHTATGWRAGFSGSAPGFAYLIDATRACGCRAGPNGAPRCRPDRSPSPTDSARYIHLKRPAIGRSSATPTRSCGMSTDPSRRCSHRACGFSSGPPELEEAAMTTLEILRSGPLALVEDLGRAGLAHLGVGRSGAADRRSHTLANRLVANPDDWATVEVTFGGFSARVRGGDVDIAVTGADTDPTVNGIMVGTNSIHHVRDGQVISLGTPRAGLRTYLAVRGGVCVEPVLGSRSYDVMSAIGPSPLRAGDVLPVGEHTDDYPELDQAPVAAIEEHLVELRVVPGPRDDWLVDPDALVHTIWMASNRSDRVGMRLQGRPLQHRWPDRQLPGEGVTRGAIQVPPNGLPVILGPDHPITGSYPVVGVITDEDIDKVAQIRPGQYVRLHWARPRSRLPGQGVTQAW